MSVSRVSAQIDMGTNSKEFVYQVDTMEDSLSQMSDRFDSLADSSQRASKGLESQSGHYDRLETILGSSIMRLDEMSVQMSGLFQSQQRLARGRKELQHAFDQQLDMKVGQVLNPGEAKGSEELKARLSSSQQMMKRIRGEYEAVGKIQEREVGQLNDKIRLMSELRQLQTSAIPTNSDEELRIAQDKLRIEQELSQIKTDKGSVANATERLNKLRERGQALEREILRLANQLATTRRAELDSAEKLSAAEDKIGLSLDRQLSKRKKQFGDTERARTTNLGGYQGTRSTSDLTSFDGRLGAAEVSVQGKILDTLEDQAAVRTRIVGLESRLAKSGGRNTALKEEIVEETTRELQLTDGLARLDEKRVAIASRRRSIQEEISRNENDQGRSVAQLANLMSSLGDKKSVELAIDSQLTRNRAEFNRMVQRSLKLGQIEISQARELKERFESINTEDQARRQLSAVGGMSKAGFALQQGAYGLEDFASQIERGVIPALSGAANNINTLLGAIGPPWIMAVSTATIAGIQFGKALGFWGSEADKAIDPLDAVRDSVTDLTSELDRLNEHSGVMTDLRIGDDLGAAVSSVESALEQMRETSLRHQELVHRDSADAVQRELDSMKTFDEGFGYYTTKGLDAIFKGWGAAASPFAEDLKLIEDRELELMEELNRLGADLTEEERERLKVMQEMQLASEYLTSSMEKQESLADSMDNQLRNNPASLNEVENLQSLKELQDEALDQVWKRRALLQDMATLTEELNLETRQSLNANETMAEKQSRIAELQSQIVDMTAQQNEMLERRNEIQSQARKLMEESVTAQDKLNGLILEQKGIESEQEGRRQKAIEEVATALEAIASVKLVNPEEAERLKEELFNQRGDTANVLQRGMIDSLKSEDAGDQFDELSVAITKQMDKRLEMRGRILAGTIDEKTGLEEIASAYAEILHLEGERVAVRQKLQQASETTEQLIISRFDGLNKELKVERERLKVAKSLADAVKGGVLTQAEADIRMNDYKQSVASSERLKQIEAERTQNKLNESRLVAQMNDVAASPELQAVTRTSQAAASAIARAAREGQQRSDQKPILGKLGDIATLLEGLKDEAAKIAEMEPVGSYPS